MFTALGVVFALLCPFQTYALDTSAAINMEKEKAEEAPPLATKRWKATFNSFYFQFYGARSANNDLYGFGDLSLALQLLSVQYQISPNWNLMVMGQFLDNQSDFKTGGGTYADRTTGPGDTLVSVTRTVVAKSDTLLFADVGVSLPTGAIDVQNKYIPNAHYIYPLQLGSGTADLNLGVTPIVTVGQVQMGSRMSSIIRTYNNYLGYHLGNQYKADAWADWNLPGALKGFSPRLLGSYTRKEAVSGNDPTLPRNMWTEVFYHPQIFWNITAALKYQTNITKDYAISGEFGVPFLQGAQNSDSLWIKTRLYANLTMSGSF